MIHCPLLISSNGFAPLQSVNRPFRFQVAWLSQEKFSDLITEKWNKETPLLPLLKSFSEELLEWNKNVFYNIFTEKRSLMARIKGIQTTLSLNRNSSLIKLESKLRRDLDIVLNQEELLWYQKVRVDWLREGYGNTTFFHLSTVIRMWKNRVVAIKSDDGEWLNEDTLVKNHIVSYFTKLFIDEGGVNTSDIPSGICSEIS